MTFYSVAIIGIVNLVFGLGYFAKALKVTQENYNPPTTIDIPLI